MQTVVSLDGTWWIKRNSYKGKMYDYPSTIALKRNPQTEANVHMVSGNPRSLGRMEQTTCQGRFQSQSEERQFLSSLVATSNSYLIR